MFDDFCPSADEEPSQTRFLATLRTWPSHARTSSQRPVSQMKLGDLFWAMIAMISRYPLVN